MDRLSQLKQKNRKEISDNTKESTAVTKDRKTIALVDADMQKIEKETQKYVIEKEKIEKEMLKFETEKALYDSTSNLVTKQIAQQERECDMHPARLEQIKVSTTNAKLKQIKMIYELKTT